MISLSVRFSKGGEKSLDTSFGQGCEVETRSVSAFTSSCGVVKRGAGGPSPFGDEVAEFSPCPERDCVVILMSRLAFSWNVQLWRGREEKRREEKKRRREEEKKRREKRREEKNEERMKRE